MARSTFATEIEAKGPILIPSKSGKLASKPAGVLTKLLDRKAKLLGHGRASLKSSPHRWCHPKPRNSGPSQGRRSANGPDLTPKPEDFQGEI